MEVKTYFELPMCDNTIILIEPKDDLLEKQGVCIAKGIVALTPETAIELLVMMNTTDQDIW